VLAESALPVELARLRVEVRLQLAEVASSRERIAQAGYAERRRIERDLHDGAQQRLVTLGIVLRRLQRSLPGEARVLVPALDAAVDEVAGAITDLRTIAAGVRPPRLDEGLAAALADLARGSAVAVEVTAWARRAPADGEAAAYVVACAALTNAVKHAAASRVRVQTTREGGLLRMTVSDDGMGGAAPAAGSGLPGMADRVAAHGGTMLVDSPRGRGRGSRWCCRAGRDRRGHRVAARGPRRPAGGRRPRGGGQGRATPRSCRRSWASTPPTSRWWTCGCRRATTTRGCAPPRTSAAATRAPPC
jgi:signal transduction histidine kinase